MHIFLYTRAQTSKVKRNKAQAEHEPSLAEVERNALATH